MKQFGRLRDSFESSTFTHSTHIQSLTMVKSPEEVEKDFIEAKTRYEDAKKQLDALRGGKGLTLKQLATELSKFGGGGDVTTLKRMIEGRASLGEKQQSKLIRTGNFNGIAARIACLIAAESPLGSDVSKSATTTSVWHYFQIWYWDWNVKHPDADISLQGDVVKGILIMPEHWEGASAVLILPNGTELTGEVWAKKHETSTYSVTGQFWRKDQVALSINIYIENDANIDLLAGAFVTADARNFSPLHGDVYFTHLGKVKTPNPERSLKPKIRPKRIDNALEQKIRLSLFQQTLARKIVSHKTLPDYIDSSYNTLHSNLLNTTFIGYYVNTKTRKLYKFVVRLLSDGRVIIKHQKDRCTAGTFRLYRDSLIRFDFDYERISKQFRYRLYFHKQPVAGWYYGTGSGSEINGNLFINRIAMQPTEIPWAEVALTDPVLLAPQNRPVLNQFFEENPFLRDYMSGAKSNIITDNELLSETPYLLQELGLIAHGTGNTSSELKADYMLYSLAREATDDGKDEWFEIIEMPLTIRTNGTVEMKGHNKTYFGTVQRSDEKIVLQFNERLLDKSDKIQSTIISCYLRMISDDGHPSSHSVGTMIRFVSTMPEARTILMVKCQLESLPGQYTAYRIFDEAWVKLRASEKGYLTRYFAGRINRLIVPNGDGKKLPLNRQNEFRELYAYAALAQFDTSDHKQFIDYL